MASSYIDPSPANFQAFKDLPRDEPIHMLNLLLYRERAEYPEGHEHAGKDWTGRRAYEEYGKTSGPIFRRVGGTIVWRGAFQAMVTGPEDRRISWSVAKSYLSALVGILLEEGQIASLDDPVTKYAPNLRGSAYDGASLRNVLHMASGVTFDED